MNKTFAVQLIDETKAPVVKAQTLTVYVPDEMPEGDTVTIGVEAVEQAPGYKATIYRDIVLPKAAVIASFTYEAGKVVVVKDAAAALLANFNYQFPVSNL
jgi:hypothetical protein